MKKALKIVLIILAAIIAAVGIYLLYMTITEYRPAAVEPVEINGAAGHDSIDRDKELSLITTNLGYCMLGKDSDFIMDGGGKAPVPDKKTAQNNLDSISELLKAENADIYLLQELDANSDRSYGIDQRKAFGFGNSAYAANFRNGFVPYPWPPLGHIESGIMTVSDHRITQAARYALSETKSWPYRTFYIKRCMLTTRFNIEGTDAQLVVVNFHLEAYSDDKQRFAQIGELVRLMNDEYMKGNLVIAGGDWNQLMPGSESIYPNTHKEIWDAAEIPADMFPEGWTLAYDTKTPSCRLLNQPYNPDDKINTQHYVIDGFLCTPNVEVLDVKTIDTGFKFTDHNPVKLTVRLKTENGKENR